MEYSFGVKAISVSPRFTRWVTGSMARQPARQHPGGFLVVLDEQHAHSVSQLPIVSPAPAGAAGRARSPTPRLRSPGVR